MNGTFEIQLETLRHKFRERAAMQSDTLERLLSDLEGDSIRTGAQKEIQQIAHSLAGAGGTFGFLGISARAAALEDLVSEIFELSAFSSACQSLISEIRRAPLRGND
jgi:chemotaxis protein histidine kinase CheA